MHTSDNWYKPRTEKWNQLDFWLRQNPILVNFATVWKVMRFHALLQGKAILPEFSGNKVCWCNIASPRQHFLAWNLQNCSRIEAWWFKVYFSRRAKHEKDRSKIELHWVNLMFQASTKLSRKPFFEWIVERSSCIFLINLESYKYPINTPKPYKIKTISLTNHNS